MIKATATEQGTITQAPPEPTQRNSTALLKMEKRFIHIQGLTHKQQSQC